ncbi:hypothetical protein EMIHUDRAFT_45750, partial [Emiliania huxleyi CCMP1516]
LLSALPCFVFGFLDNSIMLVAGDAIESSLGAKLGLSGLACAALGNVVADTTGSSAPPPAARLPACLPPTCLPAQQQMRAARLTTASAGAVGIIIGCLVGCFPLLFIEGD